MALQTIYKQDWKFPAQDYSRWAVILETETSANQFVTWVKNRVSSHKSYTETEGAKGEGFTEEESRKTIPNTIAWIDKIKENNFDNHLLTSLMDYMDFSVDEDPLIKRLEKVTGSMLTILSDYKGIKKIQRADIIDKVAKSIGQYLQHEDKKYLSQAENVLAGYYNQLKTRESSTLVKRALFEYANIKLVADDIYREIKDEREHYRYLSNIFTFSETKYEVQQTVKKNNILDFYQILSQKGVYKDMKKPLQKYILKIAKTEFTPREINLLFEQTGKLSQSFLWLLEGKEPDFSSLHLYRFFRLPVTEKGSPIDEYVDWAKSHERNYYVSKKKKRHIIVKNPTTMRFLREITFPSNPENTPFKETIDDLGIKRDGAGFGLTDANGIFNSPIENMMPDFVADKLRQGLYVEEEKEQQEYLTFLIYFGFLVDEQLSIELKGNRPITKPAERMTATLIPLYRIFRRAGTYILEEFVTLRNPNPKAVKLLTEKGFIKEVSDGGE